MDTVPTYPQKPITEVSDCWKIGISNTHSCEKHCEDLNPETQVDDNNFFPLGDESSCFCGNVAVCKGKKSKQPAPSPSSPLSPSSSDDSFHFSTGMIVFVSIVGTLVAVALVNIAVRARRRQLADKEYQPMANGVQGV